MHVSEHNSGSKKANAVWTAIEAHLQDTTPHNVMGVGENASVQDVQKAYMQHKAAKVANSTTPDGKVALEKFETAYKVITGELESRIYNEWLRFKEYMSRSADVVKFPTHEQAVERLAAVAKATKKFTINKPAVAVGAAVAAIGSAVIGIKATENIRKKKDAGENPSPSDRAQQALGFAGVAAVISAAVLMWKYTKGNARS